MDWKRVKTILIIALVGINALLGYTIYNDKKVGQVNTLDQELIIGLLSDKQVGIDPDLLDVSFDIPNIALTIQTYEETFVNTVFDTYDNYNKEQLRRLMKPIDTTLIYETAETSVLDATVLSDDDVLEQAYILMDELKLSREDIYLKNQNNLGRTGKKTILEFGQVYKGIVIRDSYMIIKFNNENLLNVERVWYDVVELDNKEREFLSPEYALFEFNRQLYNQNPNRERSLTIDNFSLIYQLRDITIADNSNVLVSGEPSVHYEITTSNDDAYLINAIDSQEKKE